MLLIDGVKYELWTPLSEDELEQIVIEHAQDIFGENSIYFDKKQKLRSLAGVGVIPDALVIMFGNTHQWHIVEVELSSHDPYQHIVPQVDRFINAIDNPRTRNKIIDALYDAVDNDELLKVKTRQVIGQGKDIHKFLADLITTPPTITIIIEKDTDQLKEALRKYTQKKVIEFQSFRRIGAEAVHVHLFEPLYQAPPEKTAITERTEDLVSTIRKVGKRVTVKDLMDSAIVEPGQTIYGWHKGKKYEATILMPTGRIQLAHDDSVYNSPSAAGKRILGHEIDGWTWWRTTRANGEECLLDKLREEYRVTHPHDSQN